jgi:hypothetical protein
MPECIPTQHNNKKRKWKKIKTRRRWVYNYRYLLSKYSRQRRSTYKDPQVEEWLGCLRHSEEVQEGQSTVKDELI